MRIHCSTAVLVTVFALIYDLRTYEYGMLFLAIGFVIVAEMANTAIEALVDMQTSSYNHLAKIAKDIAAGAVLVSAFTAIGIGIALFARPKLWTVLVMIAHTPGYIILFGVLIVASIVFIFCGIKHLPRMK